MTLYTRWLLCGVMQTGNRTSSLHAKESDFSGLLRHDTNGFNVYSVNNNMSWKRVKQQQKQNRKRRAIHLMERKLLPENEYIFNISNRLLKSVRILVEPVQRETLETLL